MAKNYKYSFLLTAFDNLDSFFNIKDMDSLNEEFGNLNSLIYENCYTIITRYKSDFKFTDNRILDKIMDNLILGSDLFELRNENDKNKRNELLTNFIDKCSINDFRIIHNFKLFVIQEIGSFCDMTLKTKENIKAKIIENDKALAIAISFKLLTLLTALEGGIIYKPLKVRDKILDVGNELNKLINPRYFSQSALFDFDVFLFNQARIAFDIDEDVKSKKEVVKILSSIYKSLCEKDSNKAFLLFSLYYNKLVDIFNMMYIEDARNVFENYLSLNIFKMNTIDLVVNDIEDNIFSYLVKDDLSDLYRRKYIVPRGGILLKFKECGYDLENIIAEGYDDLIGYYIFSLQLLPGRSGFSYFNLTGNFNSVVTLNHNLNAMFDFYGVHGRVQNGRERFTILNLNKIADNLINDSRPELNCYYADKVNYEIMLPEYWKYKNNKHINQKKDGEHNKPMVSKMIKINAFKRKLAEGQHRSFDAETLAKKLCIELKDDETIVSPFERKQKVKLNSMNMFDK